MKIGIPRESLSGETRVACTPATVALLSKLGFETVVESGAGLAASLDDAAYQAAGATVADKATVWACPLLYKVNAPSEGELPLLKEGQTIVSFLWPRQNEALVEALRAKKVNALAMDMVPRISRAQALDALSSMANISGYRAVIEAANAFGRFFTGQITAAGKVPPAQVLVIGAGVAGLAAIGTANSLGAVVRAFDTRLEVAEQIESMGGKFLKLDFPQESGGSGDGYAKVMSDEFIATEMKLFAEQAKEVDIIITTAAIPGKPAPKLITKEMVESMKSGSVIVDLAAATGGNCELTKPGELFVTDNGVKIIGYTDMANRLAGQSSQLYATNLVNLTKLLSPNKDGEITLDFEDVIIRNMTVTRDGEITFPPPPIQVSAQPQQTSSESRACRQARSETCSPVEKTRSRRHCRHIGTVGRRGCPRRILESLYRVRPRLRHRLLRRLERQPLAAYPADVRDQRHFRHHRRRRAAANQPRQRFRVPACVHRHPDCQRQHLRRLLRNAADAEYV
ncbi:NAD(P)(+) transhydrogenase (AB-specific), alpha subunit [Neisseria mucosa ATCC 25996]|uniref:NAD(P) transhydrogenase subunit alpha n=1 Tax=Neisseria mucosa (strain ATCC 25996 / DSM 4631 / NCTC 10774 / M26) TaxID=546266 RepID=D2ZZE9_NEIM2|nr:NAD(P)(+) transhydrogenase (AB-specific), alpha subunit [Neisseria mucosa ATCC 25996]